MPLFNLFVIRGIWISTRFTNEMVYLRETTRIVFQFVQTPKIFSSTILDCRNKYLGLQRIYNESNKQPSYLLKLLVNNFELYKNKIVKNVTPALHMVNPALQMTSSQKEILVNEVSVFVRLFWLNKLNPSALSSPPTHHSPNKPTSRADTLFEPFWCGRGV